MEPIFVDAFRYDTTDNNNGEETSTVTGDTSTITGDTSTVNGDVCSSSMDGSVVDLTANFTKIPADEWLRSTKHRDKRKSLNRRSRIAGSSSSTETADSGHGLTRQALRAHDYAHLPLVRQPSKMGDEESSVYSVDQEGFYTSMHKDSGLHRRGYGDTLYEEEDTKAVLSPFASSSDSTLNGITSNMNVKKDKRRRSSGFFSNLPNLKKLSKGGKKHKKIPPPPPPRISTKLDKSNLTLHMDESELQRSPSPGPSTNPPPSTLAKGTPLPGAPTQKCLSSPHSHLNDSSCESDAEVVYARLKMKTSISTAAFPSLCNITPIQSDEEDADLLTFSDDIYGSLKSTKSAPGTLVKNSPVTPTTTSPYQTPSGNTTNSTVSSGAGTIIAIDVSSCSTWPRSPNSPTKSTDKGFSTFSQERAPAVPPRTLSYRKDIFSDQVVDSKHILDRARTPETILEDERSMLGRSNSFRGSVDGSIGQPSEHSGSKTSSSLQSYPPSHSSSSIPSTVSDEQQPPLPPKYQHTIRVRAGNKTEGGKGAKVNVTHMSDSLPAVVSTRDHVYANVIIHSNAVDQLSSPSSIGSGGVINSPVAMAASTPKDSPYSSTPFTGTWPRAAKSSPTSGNAPCSKDDTHIIITSPSSPSSEIYDTNTFPRKADKVHYATAKVAGIPVPKPMYTGPVPAPAKLIISSPVATKVSFKENPYKRSVCSPVTTQELLSIWNCNVKNAPYNKRGVAEEGGPVMETNIDAVLQASEEVNIQGMSALSTPMCVPASQPLFPNMASMKHSITFPIDHKPRTVPSDYGRTWYDGIASPDKKQQPTTPDSMTDGYFSMKPQMSFTSSVKDQSNPCDDHNLSEPFDQHRDSVSSSISTDSGGKTKTFASIMKASPVNNRGSVTMEASPIAERLSSVVTERQIPKFSSFAKVCENSGQALGMKRCVSQNEKIVPIKEELNEKEKSPSPPRPTHLALAKPVEPSPKRLKVVEAVQKAAQDSEPMKVTVTATPTQNRPSPVRVVFPQTPEKKSSPQSAVVRPKAKPPAPPRVVETKQTNPAAAAKTGSAVPTFTLPALAAWPGVGNKDKTIRDHNKGTRKASVRGANDVNVTSVVTVSASLNTHSNTACDNTVTTPTTTLRTTVTSPTGPQTKLVSPSAVRPMTVTSKPVSPSAVRPMTVTSKPASPSAVRPMTVTSRPISPLAVRPMTVTSRPISPLAVQPMTVMSKPVSPSAVRTMTVTSKPVSPSIVRPMTVMSKPVSPATVQTMTVTSKPVSPPAVRPMTVTRKPVSLTPTQSMTTTNKPISPIGKQPHTTASIPTSNLMGKPLIVTSKPVSSSAGTTMTVMSKPTSSTGEKSMAMVSKPIVIKPKQHSQKEKGRKEHSSKPVITETEKSMVSKPPPGPAVLTSNYSSTPVTMTTPKPATPPNTFSIAQARPSITPAKKPVVVQANPCVTPTKKPVVVQANPCVTPTKKPVVVQANPCVTPIKRPVVIQARVEAAVVPSVMSTAVAKPGQGPVFVPPSVVRPAPSGASVCRPAAGPSLTPIVARPAAGPTLTPPSVARPAAGPILAPPPSILKAKTPAKETTFGPTVTTVSSAPNPASQTKVPSSPTVNQKQVTPPRKWSPPISQTPPTSKRMARSISVCSNVSDSSNSSKPPRPSMSSNLNRSYTSLNTSFSNSNLSLANLNRSTLSLAKSTDSLASNSSASARAERTRAAKLAFLAQAEEDVNKNSSTSNVDDRFSRFKSGTKKIDTNANDRTKSSRDSNGNHRRDSVGSHGSSSSSKSSSSPDRPSPVQGRFVTKMMSQFQNGTACESPSSPTSGSSGLGSSLPTSPISWPLSNSSASPQKTTPGYRTRSQSGSSTSSGSSLPGSPPSHGHLKQLLPNKISPLKLS